MSLRNRHKLWLAAAGILVVFVLAIAGSVYWRAGRALRASADALWQEQNLKFLARPFLPAADPGFEWVTSPGLFSQAAEYNGRLYLCGPTSLSEYDAHGKLLRQFHVGRELPPSPLLRVTTGTLADSRTPELLLASAADGILAFDGTRFRQILPEPRDARSVTAILPLKSGQLLIGTAKRGLLVYDGHRLGPYHRNLEKLYVTELAGSEADLWIGTQDQGVAHWSGGTLEWFNDATGLPDNRVYAIAVNGSRAFIGTSAGIAEFQGGKPLRTHASGAFVRALLVHGKELLAGTMQDGILEIPLEKATRLSTRVNRTSPISGVEQFLSSGDVLYAVSETGVYSQSHSGWHRVLEPGSATLTDRNISALALDGGGRLWVGYFDRGLDLLDSKTGQMRHIEDDHLFCINRVVPNARQSTTAVATANGLVLFDSQGNRRQVLTRSDGLIADHVTDVAPYQGGMAIATPAGLTFLDASGARSLYAFHGLVNNHVYAITSDGRNLLAGTLGGASLLREDQIQKNYTAANSGLKHNWITSIVALNGEWWLGTYGAGVMKMDSMGEFESASGVAGDAIINPNAMLATDRLLLAGSMGGGLYVMKRDSGRWMQLTNGLPSHNVTALAYRQGYLYVGTDNGLVRISEQRLEQ